MRKRNWLLSFGFILGALISTAVLADDAIIPISPSGPVYAGQNIWFRIQTQRMAQPAVAFLFYRRIGATQYQSLSMIRDTEIEHSILLEGKTILPPGIEYFFMVEDGRQRVFTLPDLNPRANPFRIETLLDRTLEESLLFPHMDKARIFTRRPIITVPLVPTDDAPAPEIVRLLVDGEDVTSLCVIIDQAITYTPETDLDYGTHAVSLEAMDARGAVLPVRSWTFVVPQSDRFDRASTTSRVDAEVSRQVLRKSGNQQPDWTAQSNLTLNAVTESQGLKASLGANAWYIDQEGPNPISDTFNLNNYLLQFEYREQRLAFGDLSVAGTELISDSIARRGGLLGLDIEGTKIEAFALNSNAVTGFDDIVAIDDSDQLLVGGSVEREFMADKKLTAKATFVSGRNENPDDYNAGTLAPGVKGRIYSLSVSSRPFGEAFGLSGEYSLSDYDPDTSDDVGTSRDRAWLLKFSGRTGGYDYGGGYKYLGRDFQSIATPTGLNNREDFTLYGAKAFQESSLTVNLLHSRDNATKDPLLPEIRNSDIGLVYTFYRAEWPIIFLTGNGTFQESSNEPAGIDPVKNVTTSAGGGFSLARDTWSLVPNYIFTKYEDRAIPGNESKTHNLNVAMGFQPVEKLSINPSTSYSRISTEADSMVTEVWQGTLAATVLFTKNQNLNLTLSALDVRAQDDSIHTVTYNFVGQYNWHLETSFLRALQKTFSLRGLYSRSKDQAADTREEDYAVYLLLSLGIPINLP